MEKEIYSSFKLQSYSSQSYLISCIVAMPGAQPDFEERQQFSHSGRMLNSAVYCTEICLFRKISADMEKECLEHSSKKICTEADLWVARLLLGKRFI